MKFIITHESTNYKQWNYTVEYEEHLSQLPFVTNKIVGDFVVEKSQSQRTIKSTHRTCFAKIYCCEYIHTHTHTCTDTRLINYSP